MLRAASIILLAVASISVGACANDEKIRSDIDREIKESVAKLDLPYDISEYSRYYVLRESGDIEGVYIVYHEFSRAYVKQSCEQDSIELYPCSEPDYGVIAHDQVKWLDDEDKLPLRAGGGCSFIEFKYDTANENLEYAYCNANV